MSKKFKVSIEEVVKFNHILEVETDNEFNLEEALDRLESSGNHPDDIRYYLKESGVEILSFEKDTCGECEFEVPDMEEIKE